VRIKVSSLVPPIIKISYIKERTMTGNAHSEHVKLNATMSPMQKNRALNDSFRKTTKGGVVTISMGIHFLGRSEVENILKRLGASEGDGSCDDDSEHESGEITVSN